MPNMFIVISWNVADHKYLWSCADVVSAWSCSRASSCAGEPSSLLATCSGCKFISISSLLRAFFAMWLRSFLGVTTSRRTRRLAGTFSKYQTYLQIYFVIKLNLMANVVLNRCNTGCHASVEHFLQCSAHIFVYKTEKKTRPP